MDIAALFEGVAFWHWLALGLALLIAELATGSTYLLWPAIAAWIAGLMALVLPTPFAVDLLVFSTSTLALTCFGRRHIKGAWLMGGDPALNEPHTALLGRVGEVEQAFVGGFGRVRLGDTIWRGQSEDGLAEAETVEVIGVDGSTLLVRRLRALQP